MRACYLMEVVVSLGENLGVMDVVVQRRWEEIEDRIAESIL